MENGTTLALNQNWLDTTGGSQTFAVGNAVGSYTNTIGYYQSNYPYYLGWTYPVYMTSPARPIKLTLSEIDRLRKAARTDKALKAILAKFTEQIEITVDFE